MENKITIREVKQKNHVIMNRGRVEKITGAVRI
jgi:hypothetical protein